MLRGGLEDEAEGGGFPARVRDAYLSLAAAERERFLVVDATLPVEVISAVIRQRVEAPPVAASFSQGETVLVRTGSSDLQAIFLCDDGDERAVILLNLLQREQRVSLPRSSITRLTAQAC